VFAILKVSLFNQKISMEFLKYLTSKSFLKSIIMMVFIILILIFILTKWLNVTTHHDEKIIVPNLDKVELSQVINKLDSLHLKAVVLDSTRFNPNYPKLSVIEQNPFAGDFVKENRKIYLTINPSGYRDVIIPDIFGKTSRLAIIELKNIGLRVGNNPKYINDKGKDVVRGLRWGNKNLLAGDKVKKDSKVEFILGDGLEK